MPRTFLSSYFCIYRWPCRSKFIFCMSCRPKHCCGLYN